jgi:uncharacterized protein
VTGLGFKAGIEETKPPALMLDDSGLTTALKLVGRDDPTTDRYRSHFRRGGQ